METVAAAIQRARLRLDDRTDTPRLDAELLLAHALGLTRSQLLARHPDSLTAQQTTALDELVDRREAGESVAYIIGYREFYGLRFTVSPAVLTPRPETELLVEWALGWLMANPEATVVDVGIGSGAIAIAVALNAPATVRMIAIDISPDALEVARINAEGLASGRIELAPGDLLEPVDGAIDLVLANLPYLRPDQIDGNRDLVVEPRIALDGGEAGLELINRLIEQLPARLAPGGAAALEIDPAQAGSVVARLRAALPDAQVAVHQDLAGLDRFVTAVRL